MLNLVVFAFGISSIRNSREHYERQAEIHTQNLVHAIDQSISNSTDKINQSLHAIVAEVEHELAYGRLDRAYLQKLLDKQKVLLPEAIGFRLIDENGSLILGGEGTLNPFANLADREYFQFLKSHADVGMVITKPIQSRFSNEWTVVFAYRFMRPDKSFGGIAMIPVSLTYFHQIFSHYDLGEKGILVLRDIELGLISRRPGQGAGEQHEIGSSHVTSTLRERISSGVTDGTYQAKDADGVERMLAFRRIQKAPMYVIAGQAKEHYLARWYRDVLEVCLFGIGFALTTCVLSLLLYRIWRRQLVDTIELEQNHKRLRSLLAQLHERDYALAVAQEEGNLGTFSMDMVDGTWTGSGKLDELLGIDAEYPRNIASLAELIHPDERAAVIARFNQEAAFKQQVLACEYRIIRQADGAIRWVYGFGKFELDGTGKPVRFRGGMQDMTEQKRFEERLGLAHEVFMNMHEVVIVTDADANILEVNPAFTEVTGYSEEEVLGENPRLLQSGRQSSAFYREMWNTLLEKGYWEGEFQNKRKDGRFYNQASRISAIRDAGNRIVRYIAVANDITQIRASQLQMEYLAYHDMLTDLPNRLNLAERLKQSIEKVEQTRGLLAVCYLDLDGFKPINDVWGHDVGDAVLVEAANRLQSCISATDTVARIGGDEFVVLLGNACNVTEVEGMLRKILSAMEVPFEMGALKAELSASVGVAIYPDDVGDADMLIRRADQAMYIAKRLGRNQFHVFDSETDRRLKADRDFGLSILAGLENGELQLFYQPQVDMPSGRVVGAEALIRWLHPERGLLFPANFLPVLEYTDASILLGEWVIRQALKQMAEWKAAGLEMPVSVNISGYHLQRPDFVNRLSALLKEQPSVDPQWLQLEILETIAMEDVDAVSSVIADCAELGVTFALDDFGTGYSSLTYFRRLPTHLLKIDQSFVRDILNDAEDYALVESIVKLAHSFQREVIAEGVETPEHGIPLMMFGCRLAQGFGIAKPMPADELQAWVANWRMPECWQQVVEGLS